MEIHLRCFGQWFLKGLIRTPARPPPTVRIPLPLCHNYPRFVSQSICPVWIRRKSTSHSFRQIALQVNAIGIYILM